jgi:hypothetical protein
MVTMENCTSRKSHRHPMTSTPLNHEYASEKFQKLCNSMIKEYGLDHVDDIIQVPIKPNLGYISLLSEPSTSERPLPSTF